MTCGECPRFALEPYKERSGACLGAVRKVTDINGNQCWMYPCVTAGAPAGYYKFCAMEGKDGDVLLPL